jgi:hypothetical protein
LTGFDDGSEKYRRNDVAINIYQKNNTPGDWHKHNAALPGL